MQVSDSSEAGLPQALAFYVQISPPRGNHCLTGRVNSHVCVTKDDKINWDDFTQTVPRHWKVPCVLGRMSR